jgi:thioredoxin-dependent peroxiredoxin
LAKVALGNNLPNFSLASTGGKPWRPRDGAGKKIVIYFYPRDNTPGCTQEGEDFRDLMGEFRKAGTLIFGVSPDSLESHEKFRAKMNFPFDLLSDPEKTACTLFGVIREKSMYGRKFMGVERSTFLIDAAGVLRAEWRKVKVAGHAQVVLDAARML